MFQDNRRCYIHNNRSCFLTKNNFIDELSATSLRVIRGGGGVQITFHEMGKQLFHISQVKN